MAKVTLSDLSKVFKDDKKPSDFHYYGQIVSVDAENRTYEVSINRDENITVEAARLVGAHVGDTVMVTVMANGYATVTGRVGGDTDASDAQAAADAAAGVADTAFGRAQNALATAGEAQTIANNAKTLAESAEAEAGRAQTAAETAQQNAQASQTAAETAQQNAQASQTAAQTAQQNAQTAQQNAQTAQQNASASADSAQQAATYASEANTAAHTALNSASIVEDVAGTLDWIRKHGQYILSTDTTVDPDTVYFIYDSVKQDYDPIAIPDPTKNPHQEGWYVLDITQAQSDYIMAHLAVTSRGLWVLPNGMGTGTTPDTGETQEDSDARQGSGYKALLSNSGMEVYDGLGVLVAKYGANIEFDSAREHMIGNQNSYIKYYNDDGTFKIAVKADEIVFEGSDLTDTINGAVAEANEHTDEAVSEIQNAQEEFDSNLTSLQQTVMNDILISLNSLNAYLKIGDVTIPDQIAPTLGLLMGDRSGAYLGTLLTTGALRFGTIVETQGETTFSPVAWISDKSLYVNERISFGNFTMKQRSNGHLSIMYSGNEQQ